MTKAAKKKLEREAADLKHQMESDYAEVCVARTQHHRADDIFRAASETMRGADDRWRNLEYRLNYCREKLKG